MSRLLLPLLFLVPFVELYLLLVIGRSVGAWPVLALVVGSAVLGMTLARHEGARVVRDWRAALAGGRMPGEGLLGGALVFLGGVLLAVPGVLTDVAGLVLLIPPSRRWVAARVRRSLERRMEGGSLNITGIRMGGFGMGVPPEREASPDWPTPPRRGPPSLGEVDAEFTEEGPGRS
ncbi:FxsA family protein [Myxococcaceae bacterium GXIMD 01537]